MDAALEEELYDLLTLCIQQQDSPENAKRKTRIVEIGHELAADGGADSMESMFFSIEQRIQGEISADARPYRAWWNGIAPEWKY
jgi:hypothetical protein